MGHGINSKPLPAGHSKVTWSSNFAHSSVGWGREVVFNPLFRVSHSTANRVRMAEVCLAGCLWGQMDRITYVLNKSQDVVVFPLSGQTSKRRCWVISLFFYFSIFSQPQCDGDRLGTRHTVMVKIGPGLWNWM